MSTLHNDDTVRVKKTGRLVRLDDINPNRRWREDDECWAEGWYLDGGGSATIDDPEEVERVELKPIPSAEEIAKQVADDLHGGLAEVVSVHETNVHGDTIEAFGRDSQGIEIRFSLTIHRDVEVVDL